MFVRTFKSLTCVHHSTFFPCRFVHIRPGNKPVNPTRKIEFLHNNVDLLPKLRGKTPDEIDAVNDILTDGLSLKAKDFWKLNTRRDRLPKTTF